MKNAYENLADVKRMQEEAVKRVQEMQKRAKLSLERTQPYTLKNSSNSSQSAEEPSQYTVKSPVLTPTYECNSNKKTEPKLDENNLRNSKNQAENTLFSQLMQDSEKNLIILLLMLLVDENTDISLIMALMHLIL